MTEEMTYLGVKFYDVVRQALRHGDPSEVSMFFGLPQGQMAYVMDGMFGDRARRLAGKGLPYDIDAGHYLDSGRFSCSTELHGKDVVKDGAPAWHRDAFDLLVDHWWIVRSWAQQDAGLTALMTRTGSQARIHAISELKACDVRDLAAATFHRIRMSACMPMQLAHLFADAEASHDRVAVAAGGRGLNAASINH